MSGGAPQENQTIKKVREKSNNQNPTNTTFPSHSFSVIKTIKIPGKSRKKENTVFVTWVNGWVVVTIVAAMGLDATDAVLRYGSLGALWRLVVRFCLPDRNAITTH